jgi:CRP-like cAMP-binding protein
MSLLEKKRLLGMLPAFSSWTSSALTHVSYTMTKVEYSMNDKIVMFGQALRDVFILVEGEVDLTTKIRLDKTNVLDSVSFTEVRVASLLSGSILGDLELTVEKSKTFRATARVKSSSCVLLKISTDDFKDLILNAPDSKVGQLIRRNAAATSEFRKTRLLEAQEAKKLEKKEKEDKKNSEASTVAKLRSKVKR